VWVVTVQVWGDDIGEAARSRVERERQCGREMRRQPYYSTAVVEKRDNNAG
jgi:hypothetical protein